MKKILTVIVAIVMLSSFVGISAQAATVDPGITPLWDNTASLTVGIYFLEDGDAFAEVYTAGKFGATKITSQVKVYEQYGAFWVQIAQAEQTTYGNADVLTCYFTPVVGENYKAVFTVTVTKDNTDETITKTYYRTYE